MTRLGRPSRSTIRLYAIGVGAVALLSRLSTQWTIDDMVAFNPAIGAAVAISSVSPRSHRGPLALISAAVGTLIHLLFSSVSVTVLVALVFAAAVEAVLAVLIGNWLTKLVPASHAPVTIRWLLSSLAIAAIGGAIALLATNPESPMLFLRHWVLADGLGLYMIGPAALLVRAIPIVPTRSERRYELIGTAVLLGSCTVVAFSTASPMIYLVLPVLLWLGLRGGPRIGGPACVLVIGFACSATAQDVGPFIGFESPLLHLQLFIGAAAVATNSMVGLAETNELRRVRLDAAIAAMPDLLVLTDHHDRIIESNDPPVSLADIEIDELLTTVHDHSSGAATFDPTKDLTIDLRNDVVAERLIESRAVPIDDGTRLTIIRDVTDLIMQRRALEASNDRWLRIVEASQEGILEINANAVIMYASERLGYLTGHDAQDLVGTHLSDLIGPRHWHEATKMRERAIGGRAVVFELGPIEVQGEQRWGLVSVSPQIDDGQYLGSTLFVTDITPLRDAETARIDLLDELAAAERTEQARLARDLHDGPLQDLSAVHVILGHLAALDHEHTDLLARAESAMTGALADLRSAMVALDPADIDDGGLVDALHRHALRVGGVAPPEVIIQVPHQLPTGNAARVLYRIGREAISNAIRHGDASTITIGVSKSDDGYELVVTDDGTGFVDDGGSPLGHMGIRSMRHRARQAGGDLTIKSSLGRGTTITAMVPADGRAEAHQGISPPPAPPTLTAATPTDATLTEASHPPTH